MTKRNTDQQRARELQQAEGIGYHEALNRVREGKRPEPPENNPSITLTESTLIVIEPSDLTRCSACHRKMDYGQWSLYLPDVSTYGYSSGFRLCTLCAKAIGNAVAHVPATPAPDPVDPYEIRFPEGAAPDGIVAYRSQDRVHLLCRRHIPKEPIADDYEPVASEDLENGGRCSVCEIDVLMD